MAWPEGTSRPRCCERHGRRGVAGWGGKGRSGWASARETGRARRNRPPRQERCAKRSRSIREGQGAQQPRRLEIDDVSIRPRPSRADPDPGPDEVMNGRGRQRRAGRPAGLISTRPRRAPRAPHLDDQPWAVGEAARGPGRARKPPASGLRGGLARAKREDRARSAGRCRFLSQPPQTSDGPRERH